MYTPIQIFPPIRRLGQVAVAVLGVCASSLATANTVTQSLGFQLNATNLTGVLNFSAFNPTQGTLTGVAVTVDATRRHDWAVWNALPHARSISYQTALTGTTLTANGTIYGFSDDLSGPGTTPVLVPGAAVFASESTVGDTQFLAGLTPVFPSAFQLDSSVSTVNTLLLPLNFNGALDLVLGSGQWSWLGGSNVFVDSLVDVSGTATLTYSFNPVAAPDTGAGPLLGALLFGLMIFGRGFRSGKNTAG